jgi:hypothetical protein
MRYPISDMRALDLFPSAIMSPDTKALLSNLDLWFKHDGRAVKVVELLAPFPTSPANPVHPLARPAIRVQECPKSTHWFISYYPQ